MGSLEAMEKGDAGTAAMARYFHKESDNIKVAQGVSGNIVDKGSVLRYSSFQWKLCTVQKHIKIHLYA